MTSLELLYAWRFGLRKELMLEEYYVQLDRK